MYQLLKALKYMHTAGMLHRDMKVPLCQIITIYRIAKPPPPHCCCCGIRSRALARSLARSLSRATEEGAGVYQGTPTRGYRGVWRGSLRDIVRLHHMTMLNTVFSIVVYDFKYYIQHYYGEVDPAAAERDMPALKAAEVCVGFLCCLPVCSVTFLHNVM